jgi:hypothetical protein
MLEQRLFEQAPPHSRKFIMVQVFFPLQKSRSVESHLFVQEFLTVPEIDIKLAKIGKKTGPEEREKKVNFLTTVQSNHLFEEDPWFESPPGNVYVGEVLGTDQAARLFSWSQSYDRELQRHE